uniref:Uncharacterized protein n=1 Tax=Globisporangium ultimum (strain ATCC 200006 / CBS 805.95 / DAOM BR144) TaxID=431595 RepID=K3WLI3_GLOUD
MSVISSPKLSLYVAAFPTSAAVFASSSTLDYQLALSEVVSHLPDVCQCALPCRANCFLAAHRSFLDRLRKSEKLATTFDRWKHDVIADSNERFQVISSSKPVVEYIYLRCRHRDTISCKLLQRSDETIGVDDTNRELLSADKKYVTSDISVIRWQFNCSSTFCGCDNSH